MADKWTGIWDIHIHMYPDWVRENFASWGGDMNEPHWRKLVTDGPQGWSSIRELLREMDRNEVERCVLQGWYWENAETCIEQNKWHAKWIKAHGDRLSAFACAHAEMKDIKGELEKAADWGAIGIGELLPEVQTINGWSDEGWETIVNWATCQGWPLLLHVTETVGHDYPGKVETPLENLVNIFEKHPNQIWILAHWGGGLPFYTLNHRVRRALQNCYFDTAAGSLIYDERIWQTVIDLIGAERVLFGSDFPLKIRPRIQKKADMKTQLQLLYEAGLGEGVCELILRKNAESLLGRK